MRSIVLGFALAACEPSFDFKFNWDTGTPGETGRGLFAYAEGCDKSFFNVDCEVSGPIVDGSIALLRITGDDLPGDVEATGTLAIVDVAPDGDDLLVHVTGSTGSGALEVRDGDELYDRIELTVAEVDRLALVNEALFTGSTNSLAVTAFSGTRRMFGRGAITFESPSLVATTIPERLDRAFSGTDHFVALAGAPAATTLTARVGNVTATAQMRIVDASGVASIVLTPTSLKQDGADAVLLAGAIAANGQQIRGAHCGVSVTTDVPVTVTIAPSGPVPSFILGSTDVVKLAANDSGSATVSCALGSATATATVAF